jgi:enterochelin esterase family protein
MGLRSFSFASRVLEDNPLGDPVTREVWIWEPPDTTEKGPLPVIYGLTGFTGIGAMFFHDSPWAPGLGRRLDRLYAEGAIPPMLVVAPDCFTRYGGSQFVNSTATGRYRDYVCREVVSEVETRFDVIKDRDHRFVFGKSSGGFGAISLGLDHPDLFGGVACQSGDMAFEHCYLPDFGHTVDELEKCEGLEGFLEAFDRAPKKTHDLIKTMNIVAMSACYSPDPDRPGEFPLPFELPSGRIRPRVWNRWLELDPVLRVDSRLEALESLRVLFIDCGNRDEFQLHLGARMLHETLERSNVQHIYEEFDDGHMSISYRYEASITALGRAWS